MPSKYGREAYTAEVLAEWCRECGVFTGRCKTPHGGSAARPHFVRKDIVDKRIEERNRDAA